MMLMPSNNSSGIVHYFAGKYGGIGWLMSPDSFKNPPFYLPYAIDNGAFKKWEPEKFRVLLEKIKSFHKPLWVLVPDIVGDAKGTIKRWYEWKDLISKYGYKLAFACQDGMNPEDVPREAICCFIGGTTDWKIKNAHRFKGISPLLHVGRVNTLARLKWAKKIGADSVDGTGWLRQRGKQYYDFIEWFDGSNQLRMFL